LAFVLVTTWITAFRKDLGHGHYFAQKNSMSTNIYLTGTVSSISHFGHFSPFFPVTSGCIGHANTSATLGITDTESIVVFFISVLVDVVLLLSQALKKMAIIAIKRMESFM